MPQACGPRASKGRGRSHVACCERAEPNTAASRTAVEVDLASVPGRWAACEEVAGSEVLNAYPAGFVHDDSVASEVVRAEILVTGCVGAGAGGGRSCSVDDHRVAVHAAYVDVRLCD